MDSEIVLETLEQARAFFQKDRFATGSGMTVEKASPGHAVIGLCLTAAHRNAVGGVMGGVLLTMADFACAVASHFGPGAGQHVSADVHMSFLNPCRDDVLWAEAVCLKPGKRLSWYEVRIRDGQGTLVAKADFTMCRIDPS